MKNPQKWDSTTSTKKNETPQKWDSTTIPQVLKHCYVVRITRPWDETRDQLGHSAKERDPFYPFNWLLTSIPLLKWKESATKKF
jgi:hypothetical protein